MLTFTVLNGYHAGDKAGHGTITYDTTQEQDKEAAAREFERLLAEGRTALTEDGTRVTKMPIEGDVTFLLPMAGG